MRATPLPPPAHFKLCEVRSMVCVIGSSYRKPTEICSSIKVRQRVLRLAGGLRSRLFSCLLSSVEPLLASVPLPKSFTLRLYVYWILRNLLPLLSSFISPPLSLSPPTSHYLRGQEKHDNWPVQVSTNILKIFTNNSGFGLRTSCSNDIGKCSSRVYIWRLYSYYTRRWIPLF